MQSITLEVNINFLEKTRCGSNYKKKQIFHKILEITTTKISHFDWKINKKWNPDRTDFNLNIFKAKFPMCLTSASSTILFPSGQITWSTCDLTRSQVNSGVRRLAWEVGRLSTFRHLFTYTPVNTLRLKQFPHHINLSVGVAHVADNTAVLHAVHVLSYNHVFIACGHHTQQSEMNANEKP